MASYEQLNYELNRDITRQLTRIAIALEKLAACTYHEAIITQEVEA